MKRISCTASTVSPLKGVYILDRGTLSAEVMVEEETVYRVEGEVSPLECMDKALRYAAENGIEIERQNRFGGGLPSGDGTWKRLDALVHYKKKGQEKGMKDVNMTAEIGYSHVGSSSYQLIVQYMSGRTCPYRVYEKKGHGFEYTCEYQTEEEVSSWILDFFRYHSMRGWLGNHQESFR